MSNNVLMSAPNQHQINANHGFNHQHQHPHQGGHHLRIDLNAATRRMRSDDEQSHIKSFKRRRSSDQDQEDDINVPSPSTSPSPSLSPSPPHIFDNNGPLFGGLSRKRGFNPSLNGGDGHLYTPSSQSSTPSPSITKSSPSSSPSSSLLASPFASNCNKTIYNQHPAATVHQPIQSPSSLPLPSSASSPSYTNHIFGGRYVILEPLEATSLYKCIHKETLQEYICKVVPTNSYSNYLAGHIRLDGNPGINSIEEVLVGPMDTFIVFAPSYGDLHSYVRNKKRLKESEAVELFHQIASIVADCHSNGVVLRDLKLRKFVFRDQERKHLKLETLDDAVVLSDPDDDLMSDKHGCPAYVSPEILTSLNGRYSGKAADCWSLGVILYTMLVGRYPFHDNDPTVLFCKIRRGSFFVPTSLSPLAKCIIKSLLRKLPHERMTSEDVLASKWFQLMSSPNTFYHRHHLANCGVDNVDQSRQAPTSQLTSSASVSSVPTVSHLSGSTQLSSNLICNDDKMPDQIVPDLGVSQETESASFFNFMTSSSSF